MFCAYCGAELSDDSLFCSACGSSVYGDLPGGDVKHAPTPGEDEQNASTSTQPAEQPGSIEAATDMAHEERETESLQGAPSSPPAPKRSVGNIVIASIAALVVCAIAVFFIIPYASGVRFILDAYSWEKLSEISDEIADADTEFEAIEIAKRYHLCDFFGTLPKGSNGEKKIELSDGTSASVRIVGFAHDSKPNGAGKAGITFSFVKPTEEHPMNSDASNLGGWESSDMRYWLNSEYFRKLPVDLQEAIVPVEKLTNNEGFSSDLSCVSETSDRLWLFSYHELAGQCKKFTNDGYPVYDTVLNAEGEQYKFYRDYRVGLSDGDDSLLYQFTPWWQRSPCPGRSDSFLYLGGGVTFGLQLDGGSSTYANEEGLEIVPGFCI